MSFDRHLPTRLRRLWPWALGATLGLALAALYPWSATPTVDAGDDAVRYRIDVGRELTDDDIRALAEFTAQHEGKDILLEPARGAVVPDGETRRRTDTERAAREARELAAWDRRQRAAGNLVESAAPPCAAVADATAGAPGRYLLCGGGLVAAPAAVPAGRAASREEAEERLTRYVRQVLAGVSEEEAALGLASSFSDAAALDSLVLGRDGSVTVDFNAAIRPQVEPIHPGFASHYMLEQLFSTLFQFREVTSVELTYQGDCDAFGELFAGPCQALDRELWERMQDANDTSVEYFTLGGVR